MRVKLNVSIPQFLFGRILKVQDGIFYNRRIFSTNPKVRKKDPRNDTFAILFLRAKKRATGSDLEHTIEELWQMLKVIKNGTISDLPGSRVPSGGLSVLIGYGPKLFMLPGISKNIPIDFRNTQFLPAHGGRPILNGSGLKYSKYNPENLGLAQHVVIQFISNTQLATYRALMETWKHLNAGKKCLSLTRFYTGFQRDDGRSWIGFHDEISNMRPGHERKNAIFVNAQYNHLRPKDFWMIGGTYIVFLRIEIDLPLWNKVDRETQEKIVGRNKNTGSPLIGVDNNGKPLFLPLSKTANSVMQFTHKFHNHPDYHKIAEHSKHIKNIDIQASLKLLNLSHIGRTRHIDRLQSKFPGSRRIYRQGYEFIEPSSKSNRIVAGLNFISFQNDPARLMFMLTDQNWMGKSNFGGELVANMSKVLSVQVSGIFLVPPLEEPFPGSSIFN